MTDRRGLLLAVPLLLLAACGTDQPTHQAGPAQPVHGTLPPATGTDAPGAPGVNPPSSSDAAGTPQVPSLNDYTTIEFPKADHLISVQIPKNWTREDSTVSNQRSDFVDPTGEVFLRIDASPFTGGSAKANFRAVETHFAANNQDYQRISLNSVPPPEGASDSADWQFTFQDGDTKREVIDRAYVSDDGTQLALYYSAPWAASTFDRMRAVFDHAASTLKFLQ
ncbi:MAG TPA: hypothetical protein VHC49_16810 [Mycobacteriales bacterium]|nr:hypothetical protein [Mycobacteriales bacterium]